MSKGKIRELKDGEKDKFAAMEEEIIALWDEIDAFKRSVEERPEDKQYVFYDGPPFATGLPHYGHMLGSIAKDVVPRFWTMRGYRVERRWGWDCHGLPIENIIEKDFGLNSRRDIEEYGIDKFNEACRSRILEYDADWKQFIQRIGRWVDMDDKYMTMDNSYMESVWWAFKELYEKELVYEGRRVSLYCPRCATPLSNFEIAMDNSYKDVEDPSVTWKFPLKEDTSVSLLAWTTTPWSTPGTVGLSVGPDFDYVKVRVSPGVEHVDAGGADDEFLIFVKERMDFVLGGLEEGSWEVVDQMKGSELVGLEYEPIMASYRDLPEVQEAADTVYRVYAADYVEIEEGTGIVTINGSYGEIDMEAAKANGLPMVFDVATTGAYNSMAGPYEGMNIKEAEVKLIEDMQAAGRVWKTEAYSHSYPHCYRCETPLYYFAGPSWAIAVSKVKEQMLAENEKINWTPEHLKKGRFAIGIENAPDWNISRSRFWGTAMPIWKCTDEECGNIDVVGSVAELSEKAGKDCSDLDLHRPYIDEISWNCTCGKEMKRIPEVFDCWVESGSMPYASQHYPFENKEKFEAFYPADFISEYINQTRGWFYTLHVLSTALFGEPSFRNVVTSGVVLAEDGNKMSKSKKNFPDPALMFEKYGVDPVRFYLMSTPVMEGANLRFAESEVYEIYRKYLNTFWNVFTFYKMFADDVSEVTEVSTNEVTHVMDKWVLSRVYQYVQQITDAYESYDIRGAATPLQDVVQEVSTWYLRRCRDRFKGDDEADKLMALRTLYTVLKLIIKIAAPVTPFITETIYQELRSEDEPDSVHLCMWPEVPADGVDEAVLTDMTRAREAIEKVLALRAEAKMKVRQPLAAATVEGSQLSEDLVEVMKDELNVKAVEFGDAYGLDTELTEELRMEGALREMVRQTNAARKKARLSIGDMVDMKVHTQSEFLLGVLEAHGEEYKGSVLASSLEMASEAQDVEMDIDGEVMTLSL